MDKVRTTTFTLLLLLFQAISYSQDNQVKIELHKGAYYDIFVFQDDKKINLTNFEQWVEIKDLKISQDGKFFFFRHKSPKQKAYQLSVYDFENLYKHGSIIPGFGGSFEWNNLNQIIHSWGCGTNCSYIRVYDVSLKELFITLSSGGFKQSPKGDFVIQFNMFGNQFWIYDLKTIEKESIKVFFEEEKEYNLWSLKFNSNSNFQILPPQKDKSIKPLKYKMKELKFERKTFKELDDFYYNK